MVELGVDLIGGHGSQCPGLLPLHVCIKWHAVIACGVLEYGDGIMIVSFTDTGGTSRTFFLQLHHTDSGHYLLAIDQFGHAAHDQKYLRQAACKRLDKMIGSTPNAGHRAYALEGGSGNECSLTTTPGLVDSPPLMVQTPITPTTMAATTSQPYYDAWRSLAGNGSTYSDTYPSSWSEKRRKDAVAH